MYKIILKTSVSALTVAVVFATLPALGQTTKKITDKHIPDEVLLDTIVITGAADTDQTGSYTSDAVTVAGKLATKRIDVPQSVSVLTRQQIEDQQLTTVDQALARIPGVTMISNSAEQSQYYIRGFSPESMVDGAPTLGGLNGYQQLDMVLYDRLEVLKGPAGLLMGQGSPSGVVNFVKKRPRDTFGASILTSYGSWNNKRLELDVTGPIDAEKRLRARGIFAGTNRDFYFDNAHDEKWLGAGFVEFDLTPQTMISFSTTYQHDDGPSFSGLPAYAATGQFINAPRSTNPYPQWAYNRWQTQEYSGALEHHFDSNWTAKISYTRRLQDQEFKDTYPTTGITTSGDAPYARRWNNWKYDRQSLDAFVQGPIEFLGKEHEVLLGANYASWTSGGKRVTYSSVTGNIFRPDQTVPEPFGDFTSGTKSEQDQWGVYGQTKINVFDPLSIMLGGRLSYFDSKSRSVLPSTPTDWSQGAQAKGEFTPYAAAILKLTNNINAYASYSDIFAPQTQKKANGGILDPRVGSQYEVGLKGEFLDGQLQASAAVFYIEDNNRSYQDVDNPSYFLNAGKAESKGFELEVSGEIMPGWQGMAGYTYNHTELVKATSGQGTPISNWLPEHSFKLWQQYRPQHASFDKFTFGIGIVAYSKTSDNAAKPVRYQDAYALVDLQVGYDFSERLKGTLSVNNVFDKTYRTRVGGTNTYNTFGDPRNFQVSLKKTF